MKTNGRFHEGSSAPTLYALNIWMCWSEIVRVYSMQSFGISKEKIFRIINARVSRTYPWGTSERNIEGDKKYPKYV
jgi:hypothetical protein